MSNDQYIVCLSRGCSNRIRKMTACNRASGATGGAVLGGIIGGIFGGPLGALALGIATSTAGVSQQRYCSRCISEMRREGEEDDDS